MIHPVLWLILTIIDIYTWVLIASVIASWLVAFGVINMHNRFASMVVGALAALTEPVLAPIRRLIPPFGGLDISPLVALVALWFVRYLLIYYFV